MKNRNDFRFPYIKLIQKVPVLVWMIAGLIPVGLFFCTPPISVPNQEKPLPPVFLLQVETDETEILETIRHYNALDYLASDLHLDATGGLVILFQKKNPYLPFCSSGIQWYPAHLDQDALNTVIQENEAKLWIPAGYALSDDYHFFLFWQTDQPLEPWEWTIESFFYTDDLTELKTYLDDKASQGWFVMGIALHEPDEYRILFLRGRLGFKQWAFQVFSGHSSLEDLAQWISQSWVQRWLVTGLLIQDSWTMVFYLHQYLFLK